jgi:hypothetical protein
MILLSGGAIASAALTHWPTIIIRHYQRVAERMTPTVAIRELVASRTSPPTADTTVPEPASTLAPISSPMTRQPAGSGGGAPESVRSKRTTTPSHGEDPSLVAEAMRALRLDHAPVRARALAAAYLARHPRGALAEEALAISIEAAVEHRDPDARQLGAGYLKAHPTGQLRWLAERALASGAALSH